MVSNFYLKLKPIELLQLSCFNSFLKISKFTDSFDFSQNFKLTQNCSFLIDTDFRNTQVTYNFPDI